MPVRKIPKNYRNVTGIAAHRKSEGQAMYESTLERDFLTLLAFDPLVTSFEVQPVQISWIDTQGKPHRYTPDVLVSFAEPRKPILYEVKYRSELRDHWSDLRHKFKAAYRFARLHDWRFKLITDVEIKTPYLDNVKFLLPIMRQSIPDSDVQNRILNQLKALQKSTPAMLINRLTENKWEQAAMLSVLWYLLGMGYVGCDLRYKLTMDSPIWSIQS